MITSRRLACTSRTRRGTARASAAARGLPAPLLFGFGTDGADRLFLPWLAQNVAALFTILLSIVLIALLLALVVAVWRELRRNTLIVEPIDVPEDLARRGHTSGVTTEELLRRVRTIRRATSTLRKARRVASSAMLVDLQVPGRFSLQALVRYLYRLLGLREERITGAITRDTAGYRLILDHRSGDDATTLGEHHGHTLQHVLEEAACDVLRLVDPFALARHYGVAEARENPPTFRKAITELKAALERPPEEDHPLALNEWAIYLQAMRQPQEAIEKYRQAAELAPDLAPVLYGNWAMALEDLGRFDEGRELRERAIGAPSRDARVLCWQSMMTADFARTEVAAALCRRAAGHEPREPMVRVAWAYLLYRLHRCDQAAAELKPLLELRPALGIVQAHYAMCLAATGHGEEALHAAESARELDIDPAVIDVALGAALDACGRHAEAIARFDGVLAIAPGDAHARLGLGNARLATGHGESALEDFRALVERGWTPVEAAAHAGMARASAALGRLDEAIAHFERAAAIDAHDPSLQRDWAEALALAGDAHASAARHAQAEAVAAKNRHPLHRHHTGHEPRHR